MSVSLLARQMSLPAWMAATVGASPAQPTMPVTTASQSLCRATSVIPSAPSHIYAVGRVGEMVQVSLKVL